MGKIMCRRRVQGEGKEEKTHKTEEEVGRRRMLRWNMQENAKGG
jgi:hypothetical protein